MMKICPRVTGDVTLRKYGRPSLWLVFISGKSVAFKNQNTFGFLRQIILHLKAWMN